MEGTQPDLQKANKLTIDTQSTLKKQAVLETHLTCFLRIATWQRDSHGLYDYESGQTELVQATTRQTLFVARRPQQAEQSTVTFEEAASTHTIAELRHENGKFNLCKVDSSPEDEHRMFWRVIERRNEDEQRPQDETAAEM